jgi:hypothetical protein
VGLHVVLGVTNKHSYSPSRLTSRHDRPSPPRRLVPR